MNIDEMNKQIHDNCQTIMCLSIENDVLERLIKKQENENNDNEH